MKKKKIIIIIIILLLIGIIGGIIYWNFKDNNKLTADEKRYLASNIKTVQNINVINNVNIFGSDGKGLFYDFIDDFSRNYSIKFNNVTYNLTENVNGLSFTSGNTIAENELAFYEDHYVLVSKKYEYISDFNKIKDLKIGVTQDSLSYISSFINNNVSLNTYKNSEELLKNFDEQENIKYILVPLNIYMDTILSKNYSIVYHFGDMKYYYKLSGDNSALNNILKKYYNKWSKNHFDEYYRKHLFDLFQENLKISQTEIDAMQSISYNYGMFDYSPYEILTGGNYGGIIAQIMSEFKEFSGIDIKFVKYKNEKKYLNAINKGDANIYFNFFSSNNNFTNIHSTIPINFEVLINKKDSQVINSLASLKNQEVYLYGNSILNSLLSANNSLKIKTYKDLGELKKAVKKEKIIIMDSTMYTAYRNNILNDYSSRYTGTLNNDYLFKTSANETFNKLFQNYINMKDIKEIINKGIYNHDLTYKTGTITGTIARYFMYILLIFVITFLYVYKVTKKVKISKKIKKEDKLKYIDQLTSLKNRNYLSENMEAWDKNTVYPQTIIVVGLNNLQEINDTVSYEQGDVQIKSAANILVKNQLDNSDIIRTDGNEFVIYLVGYAQKQITSYIHKLNKEFKKLPYNYGASIGYSMITDDIKSIEDAINEAIEDVNKQKKNVKKEEL